MRSVHFVGSAALDTPAEVFEAAGLRANPLFAQVGDGQIPLKLAEGASAERSAPSFPGMAQVFANKFAQLASAVPPAVELGFHLCYGDLDAKHFIEPIDAFYAPFEQLQLAASTELYLGLVHVKDGVCGSMRRDFGIASECGISRGRDPHLAPDFIDVYAKMAATL